MGTFIRWCYISCVSINIHFIRCHSNGNMQNFSNAVLIVFSAGYCLHMWQHSNHFADYGAGVHRLADVSRLATGFVQPLH